MTSTFSPDLSATGLPVDGGVYTLAALERYPKILHGITTRTAPDGGDWNLSSRRGTPEHPPSPEAALANREKLAERLAISLGSMVGCRQVHGADVALVTASDAGRGMYPDVPSIEGADAMVTNSPGLYLMALSADCPPVFFYDAVKRAVGLAHSGWKGTALRIAGNVVEAMHVHFGSEPSDITVAIGPGIGPCCYKVGPEVVEAVERSFAGAWDTGTGAPVLEARDGHICFNLWEGIRRALLDAAVPEGNITAEGVCTAHNLHTFYSHRAEAGACGLFGAVLGLRPG